jgi:hypothetical protein
VREAATNEEVMDLASKIKQGCRGEVSSRAMCAVVHYL